MRFGSTAKVLLKCKLKYYRISECSTAQHGPPLPSPFPQRFFPTHDTHDLSRLHRLHGLHCLRGWHIHLRLCVNTSALTPSIPDTRILIHASSLVCLQLIVHDLHQIITTPHSSVLLKPLQHHQTALALLQMGLFKLTKGLDAVLQP